MGRVDEQRRDELVTDWTLEELDRELPSRLVQPTALDAFLEL